MRIMVFGTFDGLHPGHLYVLGEAIRRTNEDDKLRASSRNISRSPLRLGSHLRLLASDGQAGQAPLEARSSDGLWVVVARDTNVHHIKGRAAVQPENERVAAIEKAFPSAHVILGNTKDFLQPIRDVQPNLILLGYDQKLPPSITAEDLGTPVERLEAFHPEIYKSSLRRSDDGKR